MALPSNTYWPEAIAAGARLRTHARVREVTVGERRRGDGRPLLRRGWATALRHGEDRRDQRKRCRNPASAADVEVAAVPERARQQQRPGRQELHAARADDGDRPLRGPTDADHGAWGGTVSSRHFYETDPDNDYKRGFTMVAMRGYSPLNTALATAPWGEGHHEALEHHLNHEATIWVCGDDAPEEHNRIELDEENLDDFGLPGVRTYYTLSENSKRLGAEGVREGDGARVRGGRRFGADDGFDSILGWHLLGTARMGSDPANSVVDANNRAHDVPNLYVVDGSSFSTGGAVNPTHTIQALALRAADKIWEARSA